VLEEGCGWAAQPGHPDQIRAAIDAGLTATEQELGRLGAVSRAAYERDFSPSAGPKRLLRALEHAMRS